MKVTEKKLADGVIKLDCEATAIEVNNALKEAAEAFALSMGVHPAPGKSIEELAKEQLGIADLDKIVEPNAIEVLVPRALDRRNLVPAFPPKATPTVKFERGKKFTFTLNVTVKPTYELTSYEPVEITVPPFTFDETPINQQLEEIAKSFDGVDSCYAIQAGREIRIMIKPDVISDDNLVVAAREIVRKIEDEMEYPGQIKVNVIRESRVTDYAK